MGRLFDLGEVALEDSAAMMLPVEPTAPTPEVMERTESDLAIMLDASESTAEQTVTALETLQVVRGSYASLEASTFGQEGYWDKLEAARSLQDTLARRMGVKHFVASTESFCSPHAAKACHEVALEGFTEMIAKAWAKVKDFFKEFFRRVGIFFKRLVHADMDYQSYEKYTEKKIADIRRAKMELKVPVMVKTKLPYYLADAGMESIDSDFVLNQGNAKFIRLAKKLAEVDSVLGGGAMAQSLDSFKAELSAFFTSYQNLASADTSALQSDADKLRLSAATLFHGIYSHQVPRLQDLPSEVMQSIDGFFDKEDYDHPSFRLLSVHPLDGGTWESLPRGANAYIGQSISKGTCAAHHLEDDTHVKREIMPIASSANLQKFYDDFKRTAKTVNSAKTSAAMDKIDKVIMDMVSTIEKKFVPITKQAQTQGGLPTLEDMEVWCNKLRIKSYEDSARATNLSDPNADDRDANPLEVTRAADEFYRDDVVLRKISASDIAFNLVSVIGRPESLEEKQAKYDELRVGTAGGKKPFIDFLNYLAARFKIEKVNTSAGSQANEDNAIKSAKETIESLNRYLLNLLSSLQQVYQGVTTTFYALFVELRFELLRYIYESARQYT